MSWESDWIETYMGARIRISRIIEYKFDNGVGMCECLLDNGNVVAVTASAQEIDDKAGRLRSDPRGEK